MAENGEAPDAVSSVAAIVAAAPLVAKPCTAARMPVTNGEVRMASASGMGGLDASCPAKR